MTWWSTILKPSHIIHPKKRVDISNDAEFLKQHSFTFAEKWLVQKTPTFGEKVLPGSEAARDKWLLPKKSDF